MRVAFEDSEEIFACLIRYAQLTWLMKVVCKVNGLDFLNVLFFERKKKLNFKVFKSIEFRNDSAEIFVCLT